MAEDRGSRFLAGLEDLVDPLVGQARPGGVVNADEVDVAFDAGQSLGDRLGPLGAAFDHVDAQDRHVGAELELEVLAILWRDHDDRLLDVVAVDELLGRVQPHGLVGQRRKRLLVVLVVEAAASPAAARITANLATLVSPSCLRHEISRLRSLCGFTVKRQAMPRALPQNEAGARP